MQKPPPQGKREQTQGESALGIFCGILLKDTADK